MFDMVLSMATAAELLPRVYEGIARDHITIRDGVRAATAAAGAADRERLRWIREADRVELWRADGHRSAASWVAAEVGISQWKARRWINCAHALERLPLIAAAVESGSLSLDKAVELTRFATPEDEKDLLRWAGRVSAARIRERGDELVSQRIEKVNRSYAGRFLSLQWMECRDGQMLALDGLIPPSEGRMFEEILQAAVDGLPDAPEGEDEYLLEQKLVDALVAVTSAVGDGSDRVVPTLVFHASLDQLAGDDGSVNFGGTMLHPETARRIFCDARIQPVVEGKGGEFGVGRETRNPPRWLRRQVLHRDHSTCAFHGCEMRRFLVPHHVDHWVRDDGETALPNLISLCPYHHRLVHEEGWSVILEPDGSPMWFRPSGRRYEPGVPSPEYPVRRMTARSLGHAEAAAYSRLFALRAHGSGPPKDPPDI